MKTSTKFKAGCGIIAVFGFGFVLGIISLLVLIAGIIPLSEGWKSEESKEFIASHLSKQLKLTPEQEEEFRPLVHEALDRRWEMRRDYLQESRAVMEDEFLGQAREILTEEQLAKAQKMIANWRREQEKFKLDTWESDPKPDTAIVERDGEDEKPNEAEAPPAERRVRDESTPQ